MTENHTPGPWAFYTQPQPNGCPIVGAKGLMVAMLAHSVNHADQRETALANAHLIAAAPAMLAALEAQELADGELRDHGDNPVYQMLKSAAGRLRASAIASAGGGR